MEDSRTSGPQSSWWSSRRPLTDSVMVDGNPRMWCAQSLQIMLYPSPDRDPPDIRLRSYPVGGDGAGRHRCTDDSPLPFRGGRGNAGL